MKCRTCEGEWPTIVGGGCGQVFHNGECSSCFQKKFFEGQLQGEAVKNDSDKQPWDLFPFDAADEIVSVLKEGAKKYAPRNWELGMDWSRCFSACIRHLWKWWQGEDKDPEWGLSHLAHAGCCILFLLAYEKRKKGADDRPK